MGSFATDFKAQAKASKGQPVAKSLRGWKFILSYGPTRPARELLDKLTDAQINEVMDRTGKPRLSKTEIDRIRNIEDVPLPAPDALENFGWILSAQLIPIGRSSTDADWKFIGEMVSALGIPENALETPFGTTDPNAVHYWRWYEIPVTAVASGKPEDKPS